MNLGFKLRLVAMLVLAVGFLSGEASACPGCKNFDNDDSQVAQAEMAFSLGVLFMLGSVGVLGFWMHRVFSNACRRADERNLARIQADLHARG